MQNEEVFTPPGPGVWELESTHSMRPASRAMAAVYPQNATAGFRWAMARYGLLLDYIEFAMVNRYIYICPRPVGAPKGAKGPPPKFIFKLLSKLHPEIRKRVRDLADSFATKRWREDMTRWDQEWKPAIIRENQELQSVDVQALTDAQLSAHLDRCFDAANRAVFRHHSLNATALLPLGDFLVRMREWTGLGPSDVLPLFRGSSRVSQGAGEELDALAGGLDAEGQAILAGDDPRAVLDALSARPGPAGEATRRYVDTAGVRVATGYDFADLTLSEMPELLVENIRAAVSGKAATMADEVAKREAALREKVPAEHRPLFDEMLAEARGTYRIRDERTYWNDAWSFGIARHAMLEAGRRLAKKERLHDAEHVVELTPDELKAMLAGGAGPSADESAAAARYRTTKTMNDAPRFLGGTPSGPPPADWFPPVAARAQRAVDIVMGEMFAARERQGAEKKISGFAASPGTVTGVARLVLDPLDMARVRKGEVLVTRFTAPSYNALLPLLSGIVTDRGGTLSHAAVVAREYGIPAVVGTGNATELIRDGARVRVDGGNGTVEILA
ncbi:MAG TPA: PEP-utilizing enzyme [Thermoanaerobaculia bacterium]|nr:PEP-utilizing enzyme [Thermoanaerobaculia bacterium]